MCPLRHLLSSGQASLVICAFQVAKSLCLLDHMLGDLGSLFRILGTHLPFAFRFRVPAQSTMMGKWSI